jgi:hypothetical protein
MIHLFYYESSITFSCLPNLTISHKFSIPWKKIHLYSPLMQLWPSHIGGFVGPKTKVCPPSPYV